MNFAGIKFFYDHFIDTSSDEESDDDMIIIAAAILAFEEEQNAIAEEEEDALEEEQNALEEEQNTPEEQHNALPRFRVQMATSKPVHETLRLEPSKPRVLLAASGIVVVAAIQFESLCRIFSEWADVRAVATKSALHFIDRSSLPSDVILYTDDDERSSWKKIGDEVLHIELWKWADIMVIAPLSANTLAKIAGGLSDDLLTCIVRAWDYKKPLFVAPAMNTFMWSNPFTGRHIEIINQLGISLVPPFTKRLACGDYGDGAMAEPSQIHATVRLAYKTRTSGTGRPPVISSSCSSNPI